MTFFSKLKFIIGAFIILLLILGTNLIDRSNFIRVKKSLISIYEDRLIPSEILYNISDELHHIKSNLLTSNSSIQSDDIQNRIDILDSLIIKFDETSLVRKENELFSRFQLKLNAIDERFNQSNLNEKNIIIEQIDKSLIDVKQLNKIQISEGKKQLKKGERAVKSIEFYTEIEIYMLIALSILILVLIIYKPKKGIIEDEI
ncbi:MAG: MCP four helix bundle domain-containing protein [Brumimicrobium sp.]